MENMQNFNNIGYGASYYGTTGNNGSVSSKQPPQQPLIGRINSGGTGMNSYLYILKPSDGRDGTAPKQPSAAPDLGNKIAGYQSI